MSYGLTVYNSAGQPTLEINDRLGRIVSTHTILVTTTKKHIHVPGFRNDGTWVALVYNPEVNVTTSNDTITLYLNVGQSGYWVGPSSARNTTVYIYRC